MKILMVSSEAAPFAKAGGLGDAVSALSRALSRAGHEVALVLPRYYGIDRSKLEPIEGPLGRGQRMGLGVYKSYLPGSTVETYFLEHERFFGRDGIYGSKAESDFADNPERFAFLCRGAFQLCRKLGWIPDVMHAHDWPSALVPVFLRHDESLIEFAKTASVLTIHNLGYQGVYPKEAFPSFTCRGSSSTTRASSSTTRSTSSRRASARPTASRPYRRATPARSRRRTSGFGLDGLLRHRSSDLVGILNGVDLDEWDPETDLRIPARYSEDEDGRQGQVQGRPSKGVRPPGLGQAPHRHGGPADDQKGVGELFGPLHGSAYPHLRRDGPAVRRRRLGREVVRGRASRPLREAAQLQGQDRLRRASWPTSSRRARTSSSCRAATSPAASIRCTACATAPCPSSIAPAASPTPWRTTTRRRARARASCSTTSRRGRSTTPWAGRSGPGTTAAPTSRRCAIAGDGAALLLGPFGRRIRQALRAGPGNFGRARWRVEQLASFTTLH
jgi:hypothetical protein